MNLTDNKFLISQNILSELVTYKKWTAFAENAKFIAKWKVHVNQRLKVSCKISRKNVPLQ